jgi:hypothetical protein
VKFITKEEALKRWPWLTAEDLEDAGYWEYLQSWAYSWRPSSQQPKSLAAWLNYQLGLVQGELKARQLAEANQPVQTEQSMEYLPLRVNPETGLQNPEALPLKAIWMLEAVLDPIVKNPERHLAAEMIKSAEGEERILRFRMSMRDIRKTVGRRFSYEEQIVAFANLLNWKISWVHIWTVKDKKQGWKKVLTISGTQFVMDWDVKVTRRFGRPTKDSNETEDVVFFGRLAPRVSEAILNNLEYHRLRLIPKAVYRMKEGAQLLYRQGLPFVLKPEGWRLTYDVACRVLGYPEEPVKDQPGLIERYVTEIMKTVGWRRDKKAEKKESGRGHHRRWILIASKKERAEWWTRKQHQDKILKASATTFQNHRAY